MNSKNDVANGRRNSFDGNNGPPVSKTDYGTMMFNYENHYSARLNKCFFLEITTSFEKGKLDSTKTMRLFDLNENREYGEFTSGPTVTRPDGTPLPVESTPLACVVRGNTCRSESEWRQLVKPFMED
jgi:hypothetical protein